MAAVIVKTSISGRWLILTTPLGVTDANNLSETGFSYGDRSDMQICFVYQQTYFAIRSRKIVQNPFSVLVLI